MQTFKDNFMELDKVGKFLGPLCICLNPFGGLLCAGILFLIFIPLTGKPIELGMCCWSVYLVCMSISIEREWFTISSLPPLFVITLAGSMRWGLGGILILAGGSFPKESFYFVFSQHLLSTQFLWAIFNTLIVVIFAFSKPFNRSKQNMLEGSNLSNFIFLRNFALMAGIFSFLYILTGFLFGTTDRSSDIYSYWVSRLWRADTFFVAFLSIHYAFYFVVPLVYAKSKSNSLKIILILLVLVSILLSLFSGGRGLVLYPILFLIFGLWLTPLSAKFFRVAVFLFIILGLVLIPAIEIFRSAPDFQASSRFDLVGRAQLFSNSLSNYQATSFVSRIQRTGAQIYACSDPYLFAEPALSSPRAGFTRFDRVLQVWMPTLLYPEKKELRDSHMIADEIQGSDRVDSETKKYSYFPCVSYVADLYWRGGWQWVWIGSLIFAVFYRLASQLWYVYGSPVNIIRFIVWIYPITFLVVIPASSIGETAWMWLWNLPKYIILGLIISLVNFIWRRLYSVSP